MKIGLHDSDRNGFPNFALMKLSQYHSRIYPEVLICTLTKMCGETDPEFFCANGEREEKDG